MFTEAAELYDLIYSTFKDYAAETSALAALIRREHPHAKTILDVACGSAEHARLLARDHGFNVDGLDLDSVREDCSRQATAFSSRHFILHDGALGVRRGPTARDLVHSYCPLCPPRPRSDGGLGRSY